MMNALFEATPVESPGGECYYCEELIYGDGVRVEISLIVSPGEEMQREITLCQSCAEMHLSA